MALKDILVHLDGRRGHALRLGLAAALAHRHGAHLTGLYGVEPVSFGAMAVPSIGSYAEVETMHAVVVAARAEAEAAAGAIEAEFRAALAAGGISGDWQVVPRLVGETVTQRARCADLTVLGQLDPDDPGTAGSDGLPERALLGSGRPVLLVPYVGDFATLGSRVLIAWNSTREAARAVGDALPLIDGAGSVIVLSVGPPDETAEEGSAAELVRHLARHGIAAEVSALAAGDIGIGDLILSRAADLGADLIVMGGYGHSPTRELILGGATRSLLQHMTVPVLMAH